MSFAPRANSAARRKALRSFVWALTVGVIVGLATAAPDKAAYAADMDSLGQWSEDRVQRLPQDESLYFLLVDRFANGDPRNDKAGSKGGRLEHGFDPTHKGFYHGGDFKGLTSKLDYIQGLGATAIWVTPIFRNKWVQGAPGKESSGYHGYWITDFLDVDPHLGSRKDFKAFVDAAHARGMKVYMDIITNHTADVIAYKECNPPGKDGRPLAGPPCAYRSIADYPYSRKGGANGEPINPGFRGDGAEELAKENFAKLTRTDYAYTPYVPKPEQGIKNPAWLNDVRWYHNRGETRYEGENSQYGDFAGLDDLFTEDPRVVDGMAEIYKSWITDFRVDGFRIDTQKHVRPEFWQKFIPQIEAHAKAQGIEHFHIFGEVYNFDAADLARHTVDDGMPSVLDFAFQGKAADYLIHGKPARDLENLFKADKIYARGEATAAILPTFLSNHDMGRFAGFLRQKHPQMSDAEALARLKLAHALMMTARGVPVVYYGDEQGFVSDGGDQDARETLFASQVTVYNDNDLIGTDRTTAQDNFSADHPLYRAIRELNDLRKASVALRRGRQIVRYSDEKGGLLVFSRIEAQSGEEVVVAINATDTARSFNTVVNPDAVAFEALRGSCSPAVSAPGSYAMSVAPLDFVICRTRKGAS
ncbi:MAG: alpha-amylase family glycosyl hydrolase [Asticcacaulis sp.]